MTLTPGQNRILHVAKAQLGLHDDTWRAVLVRCGGVASSKDLDRAGFAAVLDFLKHCGFNPLAPHGPSYGTRTGFASPGQVELIRELWREYCRTVAFDEERFNQWLQSKWHVSSLRFLTDAAAPKVITALKAMKSRPGRKAA